MAHSSNWRNNLLLLLCIFFIILVSSSTGQAFESQRCANFETEEYNCSQVFDHNETNCHWETQYIGGYTTVCDTCTGYRDYSCNCGWRIKFAQIPYVSCSWKTRIIWMPYTSCGWSWRWIIYPFFGYPYFSCNTYYFPVVVPYRECNAYYISIPVPYWSCDTCREYYSYSCNCRDVYDPQKTSQQKEVCTSTPIYVEECDERQICTNWAPSIDMIFCEDVFANCAAVEQTSKNSVYAKATFGNIEHNNSMNATVTYTVNNQMAAVKMISSAYDSQLLQLQEGPNTVIITVSDNIDGDTNSLTKQISKGSTTIIAANNPFNPEEGSNGSGTSSITGFSGPPASDSGGAFGSLGVMGIAAAAGGSLLISSSTIPVRRVRRMVRGSPTTYVRKAIETVKEKIWTKGDQTRTEYAETITDENGTTSRTYSDIPESEWFTTRTEIVESGSITTATNETSRQLYGCGGQPSNRESNDILSSLTRVENSIIPIIPLNTQPYPNIWNDRCAPPTIYQPRKLSINDLRPAPVQSNEIKIENRPFISLLAQRPLVPQINYPYNFDRNHLPPAFYDHNNLLYQYNYDLIIDRARDALIQGPVITWNPDPGGWSRIKEYERYNRNPYEYILYKNWDNLSAAEKFALITAMNLKYAEELDLW